MFQTSNKKESKQIGKSEHHHCSLDQIVKENVSLLVSIVSPSIAQDGSIDFLGFESPTLWCVRSKQGWVWERESRELEEKQRCRW